MALAENDFKYIVRSFIISDLPSGDMVVQHDRGIVRVNNTNMKRVIRSLDTLCGGTINHQLIANEFGDQTDEAIFFLIENGILDIHRPMNFNVSAVRFATNCKSVGELLSKTFDSESDIWHGYGNDFTKFKNNIELNNHEFFLAFLNPYDKELAKSLRNLYFKNGNTISIMSYIYNNQFYIESPYSFKWKSPCHQCQMGHLESELRYGANGELTYQQLVDNLYLEHPGFSVETPLAFRDVLNISTQLVNRIDKLIMLRGDQTVLTNDFTTGLAMNLATKEITIDTTHHWELCDCYE